jgi:long-subunit acyl-CoA synthetase (AMP-forming)
MAVFKTILDHFHHWETNVPDATFLVQPVGDEWREYSWHEAGTEARKVVSALKRSGLIKGDRVAILSANCAQWVICDLALMMGGFISVPLYANLNPESLKKILADSGAKMIFTGSLADKDWKQQKDAIDTSITRVSMNGYEKQGNIHWDEFLDDSGEAEIELPKPDSTVTFIYTSGTTGDPKGVVHTHASVLKAVETAAESVKLNRRGNRFISYLPLSHAAERGIVEMGAIYSGGSITFVASKEGFIPALLKTRPTHFFGVPRIWENVHFRILEKIPQYLLNIILPIPLIGNIIRSQIKSSIGLDKADVIISGAAPISPELIRWYMKVGITIREGYGLSENFNVISVNPEDDIRIGTVGKIFSNQVVEIDPQTHEIIQKCDWLMKEYFNKPEKTQEALVNGYLHTGDTGSLSADGYLTVTGRLKDIFKTSKGEYITPVVYEHPFLDLDIVKQTCVVGRGFPQPFILIVLSEPGKASSREEVNTQLKHTLAEVNKSNMQYQKLKKAIVVKDEWTIENNLLTPTLKKKRHAISAFYEDQLSDLYHTDNPVEWQ